jgi:hypothetical protein
MTIRRVTGAALIAAAMVLAAATSAGADSIVYVKDANVWIANADGSGPFQVTLDGTQANPYESPSQADDGTILAVREPPGGRRQLVRMHQNGELLNPPINTPAPGTGAIDAKISPDGSLAAYWFITTVQSGVCVFCVELATRTLLTHVDRFTDADEVHGPQTGTEPSWMSNDTLLLSQGSTEQWYFKLGTTEGQKWWADVENNNSGGTVFENLGDSEASRDGSRIAVVRGDNLETIQLYASTGAPPAIPTAGCTFTGASGGQFHGPTWSQDGQTLAWTEGDGVWTAHIGSLTQCDQITGAALKFAGAKEPDFGPAAVNPGPRPGCGNPGNPVSCPTPGPGPTPTPTPTPQATDGLKAKNALTATLKAAAIKLRKLRIHGLLSKRRVGVLYRAPAAGTLTAALQRSGVKFATGKKTFAGPGKKLLVLTVTTKGRKRLPKMTRLRATLKGTFSLSDGTTVTVTRGVRMRR